MQDNIQRLRDLAAQYMAEKGDAPCVAVYYLSSDDEAEPAAGELMRVGGAPVGFASAEAFPVGESGERMEHIVTFDLAKLPLLAARLPQGLRALSLFVADPQENEAYSPASGCSAWVMLTAEQVAQNAQPCADYEPYTQARAVRCEEVQVPIACFERLPAHVLMKELQKELFNAPCYLLGAPIWLQGKEGEDEDFLGQFDEKFADINLGDCGVMYLFKDTAFWQCY